MPQTNCATRDDLRYFGDVKLDSYLRNNKRDFNRKQVHKALLLKIARRKVTIRCGYFYFYWPAKSVARRRMKNYMAKNSIESTSKC
jgi:hypothetical protein